MSRKIKSVLEAKAKFGAYVGVFVSYGYKKGSADKGPLVVDPYATEIVRRILIYACNVWGYRKIASILNRDGILVPRTYCYQSEGRKNLYKVICVCSDMMVKTLLRNEVYFGHSVKLKKGCSPTRKSGLSTVPGRLDSNRKYPRTDYLTDSLG